MGYTDAELTDYKFGIRLPYYLCGSIVVIGLVFTRIDILTFALVVAFLGMIPPYHPFDYLYNHGVRRLMDKPKIPPRSNQGRFACGIATVWLAGVIYLFNAGLTFWGYMAGVVLVAVATVVSTLDICIPQ